MTIRFNVKGYIDRRSKEQLESGRMVEQERADGNIERLWRERVRNNWKERARVQGVPRAWLSPPQEKPGLLSKQAN